MTKQNDKCKEDLDGRFLAESEDEDKKNLLTSEVILLQRLEKH